jgi:hypothetical protein
MGTMRLALRLALPVGALLIGLQAAAAQDRMAEARQACTPDAMRLCSEFVPDANRVRACMMSKRSQLSQPCRVAMARMGGGGRHGHHYRGHKHCYHGRCHY